MDVESIGALRPVQYLRLVEGEGYRGRGAPMPTPWRFVQQQLDLGTEVNGAVFSIDEQGEHGEVFTRRWIVELILDLSGFTADRDLAGLVALEPSCGSGAFLVPMTERLIDSCRRHGLRTCCPVLVPYLEEDVDPEVYHHIWLLAPETRNLDRVVLENVHSLHSLFFESPSPFPTILDLLPLCFSES